MKLEKEAKFFFVQTANYKGSSVFGISFEFRATNITNEQRTPFVFLLFHGWKSTEKYVAIEQLFVTWNISQDWKAFRIPLAGLLSKHLF